MNRRTYAFKAIGLAISLALGLTLAIASPAVAETFKVLGEPITETAEATVETDTLGVLSVPAINLEIDCIKIDTTKGDLLVTGFSDVVLSLLECTVYGTNPSLKALAGCEVYPTAADRTAGTNKGTITVKALIQVIEHEGKEFLLAQPLEGAEALFTKIFYKNCGSSSADVKGSIVFELTETTAVKQLVKPASAGLFESDKLLYGLNSATLEGSVWAKLAGALTGEWWGIEPYPTEDVFKVLGEPITETAEATVETDTLGVLSVPAINLEIDCIKIDTTKGDLLVTGFSDVVLSLLECTVYGTNPSLKALAGCEVYPTAADRTAGTNKGTITVKALIQVIEHEGKEFLLAQPLEGAEALFTKIFYKNCGSSSADVKGSIVFELTETTAVKQLVKPASAGLFESDKLLYGLNSATLEGSVWAKLAGALTGEWWGIEPYPTEDVFKVLGEPITETAEATVETDTLGVLSVPAINLEIDCIKIDTTKGDLLVTGFSDVVLSLLECTVYGTNPSLKALAGCEVYPTAADRTAGTNKGTITVKALIQVIEHEGKEFLLAQPLEGAEALFTKIFYKNCGSSSADVKGSIVFELTETTAVKQLVKPASAGLFESDKLLYGLNSATLEGSVWAKLAGALTGEAWGIG